MRHRHSIRLKDYDYSQEGAYFVTICTYRKQCLFGKVIDGKMRLNEVGKIVKEEWELTPKKRANIIIDEFIVMPNHLHGIIIIDRRGVLNTPQINFDSNYKQGRMQYAPTNKFHSPKKTLGSIIRGFKSATTAKIRNLLNEPNYPVWQRNYYEHIIRNEIDLHEIVEYITCNPLKWSLDEYYRK